MTSWYCLEGCCKMCGLPLPQRFKGGDFDYTQYHAWLYHFDLVDSYNPQEVRQLIEQGHITEKESKEPST